MLSNRRHAPHYPATPAPWYEKSFASVVAPRTPNYNVSSPDKAQHIRQNAPLSALAKCWEDEHFRDRWRSLLSVDDLLVAVVDKLEAAGVLNKTFIIYSSDHGEDNRVVLWDPRAALTLCGVSPLQGTSKASGVWGRASSIHTRRTLGSRFLCAGRGSRRGRVSRR